jgi:hypothetical protein
VSETRRIQNGLNSASSFHRRSTTDCLSSSRFAQPRAANDPLRSPVAEELKEGHTGGSSMRKGIERQGEEVTRLKDTKRGKAGMLPTRRWAWQF